MKPSLMVIALATAVVVAAVPASARPGSANATTGTLTLSGKNQQYTTMQTVFSAGRVVVTVSGTINTWPANVNYQPYSVDAVYCYGGCARYNRGGSPKSVSALAMSSLLVKMPHGKGVTYGTTMHGHVPYNKAHVYHYTVKLAHAGKLQFRFQDATPSASDNKGAFRIQAVHASGA